MPRAVLGQTYLLLNYQINQIFIYHVLFLEYKFRDEVETVAQEVRLGRKKFLVKVTNYLATYYFIHSLLDSLIHSLSQYILIYIHVT